MSLPELRAAIQAGQIQTARWLFVQLLDDSGLTREELAEAYCEASVAEFQAGHLHTAITWARVAAAMASETNQLLLLSRVSFNMIEFQRLTGNLAGAIETGLRWLREHGDKPEVAFRKGRFYYNLAVTFDQREEVDQALEFYKKAWNHQREVRSSYSDAVERERSLVYEVKALQNAAWLLYERENWSLGDEMAGAAHRLIPAENALLVIQQKLLDALKALGQGDNEGVLSTVHQIFSSATSIPPRQSFWLYWLTAKSLVRKRSIGIASVYAAMATQEADDIKDGRLIQLGRNLEQEISEVTS